MTASGAKVDKYEQVLALHDWHALHPPRGYRYGVGRGAKAFVTTAELSVASAKLSREEDDFFAALERVEGRRRGRVEELNGTSKPSVVDSGALGVGGGSSSSSTAVVKLSMEDLACLEAPISNSKAASGSDAGQTSTSLTAATAGPLVLRSARTEEGEGAEEHFFSDERVLTAYDVLKGKTSAMQAGLQSVLSMGSAEEQTTWITHARAYREMGMSRKAHQTLVEGCAVVGGKGRRLWEERLLYISKDDLAARRRLLEEATAACPWEEKLWAELLDAVPPLEEMNCLQRAVLACPSSELLWVRLVQRIPSAQDQRALLHRALQYTPRLPLLWARLARLEPLQTGKEMFQAAAARYPSLVLIIEAAKYVEWWHLLATNPPATALTEHRPSLESVVSIDAAVQKVDDEVGSLIATAQEHYLRISEAASRQAWLEAALQLLEEREQREQYICTAAHMFLSVVDPNGAPRRSADSRAARGATPLRLIPSTWVEDLLALLPSTAHTQHGVLCALWLTWLHILHRNTERELAIAHADAAAAVAITSATASVGASGAVPLQSRSIPANTAASGTIQELGRLTPDVSRIIQQAIATAPERLLQSEELSSLFVNTVATSGNGHEGSSCHLGVNEDIEEEEVEELGRPLSAPSSTLDALQGRSAGAAAVTTVATPSSSLSPLAIVLCCTAHVVHTLSSSFAVAVPMTVSKALYHRGSYRAALSIVEAALHTGGPKVSVSLYVAKAKILAALGDEDTADACLVEATRRGGGEECTDVAWVKLAVHRRSRHVAFESVLQDGIQQYPSSARLWLMLLEEKLRCFTEHRSTATPVADGAGIELRELRSLCKKAVSKEHCATSVPVWVFCAVRVEASALQNVAGARALLTDASQICAGSLLSSRLLQSTSPQQLEQQVDAFVQIGVATAKAELIHGSPSQALEAVHDTLQRVPKTRDGALAVRRVGELLNLYITLEAPSSRGRAAAQVMRQWKSRDPLALIAVAQLYFSAGQYAKALEQAIKAVHASGGRCGDAVALVWRMAEVPAMQPIVGPKVLPTYKEPEPGASTEALPPAALEQWVLSLMQRRETEMSGTGTDSALPAVTSSVAPLFPNSGPKWIQVSKIDDPSNVTLVGYRRPLLAMLRDVANALELRGPVSTV